MKFLRYNHGPDRINIDPDGLWVADPHDYYKEGLGTGVYLCGADDAYRWEFGKTHRIGAEGTVANREVYSPEDVPDKVLALWTEYCLTKGEF